MANMTVSPQGNIYLCTTKLENDYKNQLTFATASAQLTYFNTTIQKSYSNYTYVKKDNYIQVSDNIDTIIGCNYLFYKNTGFTNKIYYCFITRMEYINENCTRIYFETDVFQTWLFQLEYEKSFVEREHVNDDTVGLHTVPEGLETGEYVCNHSDYYDGLDDLCYVIQCTEWSSGNNPPLATNFGGVYMAGGAYYTDNITVFVNILEAFANAGRSDAIYNCYVIPKLLINYPTGTITNNQYPGQSIPVDDYKIINKPSTLDTYQPINNKLKTFPYMYLLVSNNNGSSNVYHYERFHEQEYLGHCDFEIKGVPVVGGSVKLVPMDYDSGYGEENGLIGGKFPTLNWSDDEYTNWLTQNSVNLGLGVVSAGLNIIGGAGMMIAGAGVSGAGSVVNGSLAIANQLGQIYEHSLVQHSARGNTNGGDINVCSQHNGFYFYQMSIKKEYAQIIDNYFSMFGYKVNRVKIPNITGRTNWNYVKTINCNFDGEIPQTDLQIIKRMFDNGVTLWHNPSTMLNYSNTNNIVT